jgi:hypothetical protein
MGHPGKRVAGNPCQVTRQALVTIEVVTSGYFRALTYRLNLNTVSIMGLGAETPQA